MAGPLDGKVAIVTGGGRGIGRALALGLGAAGAKVVVNDLGTSLQGESDGANPAEDVAAEIIAAGGQAVADNNSVSDPDGAEAMVKCAVGNFGRLDTVLNNAGIVRDGLFHKMSFDNFDSVTKVHLYGSYNVSRAAATVFREQESGSYVHFTSTAGLIGNLGQANYSSAKAGIAGLSRSIAIDMKRFGIRSNCIAPFALTRMVTSVPTGDTPEFAEKRKHMTAEKLVPMSVFLASDDASDVTGQVFAVRGNEIFVMSQPRPIRGLHRANGWTHDDIRDVFMPSVKNDLTPFETTMDVFFWDAI
ncbi:SDR family oxidoreductase [Nitratireductor alexandrii]|uniref:SDR family oxidoreductase n=1 Tax=Nitratireductor alexandrii TaxID=2448161 RepID=UPI000FDBA887|nr:SDR family oxidoreductase [Nitratireductor alexandrii]